MSKCVKWTVISLAKNYQNSLQRALLRRKELHWPRTYNTVRASHFSIRVINVWNSLPDDCVDFSSFASFKRAVKQIDFNPFLFYHVWLKHNSNLYIIISLFFLLLLFFSGLLSVSVKPYNPVHWTELNFFY